MPRMLKAIQACRRRVRTSVWESALARFESANNITSIAKRASLINSPHRHVPERAARGTDHEHLGMRELVTPVADAISHNDGMPCNFD